MLARKAVLGSAMMVGVRLLSRFIDLGTILVLARVLDPHDFGLVAIALSVVSILEAALELSVAQALVRLPTLTKPHYDTAFTLSILRGLLLTSIALAAAWPLARFYGDHRLILLACMLSLAPAARGAVSPRLVEYQRAMSFWRDFSLELVGKLVAAATSVAIALETGSYWSLAAGAILFPVAMTAGSYVLAPYRPRFSLAKLPDLTNFVGWLSVSQVINALNWQFERLLLGKLMPTSRVGLFTTSSDVASIPFLAFFGPIIRPLLAAFSRLRDDRERVGRSYLTASTAIVALGLPILAGESVLAGPLVQMVLGEKWGEAVWLVRWLAISLMPALLALPAGPLVMAFGQTRLFVWRNAIECGIKLPVAIIGVLHYGFAGIILARFLSEIATGSYSMVLVKRLTGLTVMVQLAASWRAVASTVVMAAVVALMARWLEGNAYTAPAILAAAGTVGAACYAACLWLLWLASARPPSAEAMAVSLIQSYVMRLVALLTATAGRRQA